MVFTEEMIKAKFKEKWPKWYEGCLNHEFIFSGNNEEGRVTGYNDDLDAFCTFKYSSEFTYSIEIKIRRPDLNWYVNGALENYEKEHKEELKEEIDCGYAE